MPLFEYQCGKCGHRFEYLAKSGSDAPDKCPKCGAKKPTKQLSTFSASVHEGGSGASCSTGSCPTGTCPFA